MLTRALVLACIGVVSLGLPAGASGGQPASNAVEGSTPVARVGTRTITAAELDEMTEASSLRLRTEVYNLRRRLLEEEIAKHLIALEAKSRQITPAELLRREVEAKTEAPSDRDIRAAIDIISALDRARSAERPPDQIRLQLLKQRQIARQDAFIEELRARYPVSVSLDPPRLSMAIPKTAPVMGRRDAPLTIVEFGDYTCGYCASFATTLKAFQAKHPESVAVVFRHFPLSREPRTTRASEAAICAGEQGRFWEYHDRLYQTRLLGNSDLDAHAAAVNLDLKAFQRCLETGDATQVWNEDRLAGERADVSSTPTVFVNGRQFVGALTPQQLEELLAEELRLRAASNTTTRP